MTTNSSPPPSPHCRRFGVLFLLLMPSLVLLSALPATAAAAEEAPRGSAAAESLGVPARATGGATASSAATKPSFRRGLSQFDPPVPIGALSACTAEDVTNGIPCCHPQDTAYCKSRFFVFIISLASNSSGRFQPFFFSLTLFFLSKP